MTVNRRSLLVVEDLGISSQLTERCVQDAWDIHAATSAREAIYVAKRHPIDYAVIAITLPDERGDVVFYRLAALYPHLRSRTVFVTQSESEQRLVQTIGCQVMAAPVDVETLLRTVAKSRSEST